MEPQASSPYRRLYGCRSEEHAPAHALILAPVLHPLAHQLTHSNSHILQALYIRLSGAGGK